MIDASLITIGMAVRVAGYDGICHVVDGWRFSPGQGLEGGMYTVRHPDSIETRHSTDQLEAAETATALR